YHADNGLFDTKKFKESIAVNKQTLSFCGPNAHHQNGKAENRIKDVTTHSRTALLHAAHRWPQAINAHLWPAALKHYTNVRNSLPTKFSPETKGPKGKKSLAQYDNSPLSRFSGSEVEPNLDHFHPFGCPVYVLEDSLQSQQSHNKWSDRSRVGIFLCHSPRHATSVPLVLNTQTGNVAPQFHCIYDDEFATCKRDAKFSSLWQAKAQFTPATTASDNQATNSVSTGSIERFDYIPTQPVPTQPADSVRLKPTAEPSDLPQSIQIPASFHEEPIIDDLTTDTTATRQTEGAVNSPATEPLATAQLPNSQSESTPPIDTPYVSRSGRAVRPRKIFTLLASFLATTSPFVMAAPEGAMSLIQPDIEANAEPHPMAFL
ncbi:MAG: hypothetical protein AAGJ35_14295, partial [Myxococcota bacterium]